MTHTISILVLLSAFCGFAEPNTNNMFVPNTNNIFVTQDGFVYRGSSQRGFLFRREALERAKKSRESLPAKDFPEGNWGDPKNGFQLSVRTDKSVYKIGETITAVVLVRNISTNIVSYFVSYEGRGVPFHVSVVDDSGNSVAERPLHGLGGAHNAHLIPNLQDKYGEALDQLYVFTRPGKYSVKTEITAPTSNGEKVCSGTATFTIEESGPSEKH